MRASTLRFATTCALLLGLEGAVAAATISTGMISGGTRQTDAVCYIRNVGRSPVFVDARIVDGMGNDVTDGNFCGTVPPGHACAVSALNLAPTESHACTASFKGGQKKVRGTLDIRRESAGQVTILNTDTLR
jgi:hypothetical protein